MIKGIEDRRIRQQISDAITGLSVDPEIKGKALLGELAGYRSLRAAGQRYRGIYQVVAEDVFVVVVAVGKRKDGDRKDVYSLARKLFRQKLVDKNCS
jgi:mRNA interferase RelE/StbE